MGRWDKETYDRVRVAQKRTSQLATDKPSKGRWTKEVYDGVKNGTLSQNMQQRQEIPFEDNTPSVAIPRKATYESVTTKAYPAFEPYKYNGNDEAYAQRESELNKQIKDLSFKQASYDPRDSYSKSGVSVEQTNKQMQDYQSALNKMRDEKYNYNQRGKRSSYEAPAKSSTVNRLQQVSSSNDSIANKISGINEALKPQQKYDASGMGNARGKSIVSWLTDDNYKASEKADFGNAQTPNDLLSYLTDDEKRTVLYYAGKKDYKSVEDYYNTIERDLNARAEGVIRPKQTAAIKDNPILAPLSAAATSLAKPAGIIATLGQNIKNRVTGEYEPVDPNSRMMQGVNANTAIHQGFGEAARGVGEKIGGKTGGDITSFLADTGLSVVEYAATLPFGENAALAIMSSGAAGQTANDAVRRGATADEALMLGTASGAIEFLTEKLPLESLFKAAKTQTITKEGIKQILKQAGIEGGEELISEYANLFADISVMGDRSEYEVYRQQLIKDGYSERDATNKAMVEFAAVRPALSALGGALSGGVMGAGATAVGNYTTAQVGKSVQHNGALDTTLKESLAKPQDTEAYKQATNITQSRNVSNYDVGKLYEANESAAVNEQTSNIAKELISSGVDEANATTTAEAVRKVLVGEAVSNKQAEAILSDDKARSYVEKALGATIDMSGTRSEQRSTIKTLASLREAARTNSTDDTRAMNKVSTMDTKAARVLATTYDAVKNEITLPEFVKEFQYLYDAGRDGTPKEALSRIGFDISKIPHQFAAYTAGAEAAAAYKASRVKADNAIYYGKESKFIENKYSTQLSQKQKDTLHLTSQALGINTIIDAPTDGAEKQYNGFYEDGVLHIAADAEDALDVVFKHEITHRLKEAMPSAYAQYENYVINTIEMNGFDIQKEIDGTREFYASKGVKLDDAKAREEYVAKYTENLLTDKNSIEQLIKTDRTLAERVFDAIKKIITRIKKALGGDKLNAETGMYTSQLEQAEKLWTEAFDAASYNSESKSNVKSAAGDVQAEKPKMFSLKDSEGRELTEEQVRYFKDSKVRTAEGNLLVLYHQTNNDFTVFDPKRSGAGTTDNQTPYGIFMKPSTEDLKLGDKQMPLYANIKNPLYAFNRNDVDKSVSEMSPEYKQLANKLKEMDADFKQKYEATEREYDEAYDVWYKENVTKGSKYSDAQAQFDPDNKLADRMEENSKKIKEEWESSINSISVQMKKALTDALTNNGYDGMLLWKDEGSFGKVTRAYIALEPSQVKSIDNDKPTSSQDIRFSLKDSEGRRLTQAQAEFFKDSKARDESGNLLVMYHGTPYGGFTQFKGGNYFTYNREYADRYQNPSASSVRGKYDTASSPQTYEVYLNIKKPFDTRKAAMRRVFMQEYYRKYGSGSPLMKSGLPDWTDGFDLIEFFEEKGYDYDGLILDEGADGGYGEDVIKHGLSYVPLKANQIKSVGNQNPTGDPDIRYSLKGEAAYKREISRLKDTISSLRAEFKTTERVAIDPKQLTGYAKELLSEYDSDYDRAQLESELKELYDIMGNPQDAEGNETSWDDANEKARSVAWKILDNAEIEDGDVELNKEVRETLRTTRIDLSPDMYAELPDGNAQAFYKSNMGRLNLRRGESSNVDSVYKSLAEDYPSFFPEYIVNPADQLNRIVEVRGQVDPSYTALSNQPYMVDSVAAGLLDAYFELPQQKTFADKQEERVVLAKVAGNAKYETARDRSRAKVAELKAHYKDRLKQTRADYRAMKERDLQKQRDRYKQRDERLAEMRSNKEYRANIRHNMSRLSQLVLKPNEKQHIPDKLLKAVSSFLSSVELASDRMGSKTVFELWKLRAAMDEIAQSYGDDDAASVDFDPSLSGMIKKLYDTAQDKTLLEMNNSELELLDNITRAIMASIRNYNRLFTEGQQAYVADIGDVALMDLATEKPFEEKRFLGGFDDTLNMDMLAPIDFFDELGETWRWMYDGLRNGFNKKIRHIKTAQDYMKTLVKDVDIKKWTGDKAELHQFKTDSGKFIRLTTSQVMSMYLLNKQADATRHMMGGGIKSARLAVVDKYGKKVINEGHEATKMTEYDFGRIFDTLTKEQKEIADAISKFFTETTSAWGNEVSLELDGYRKFTVKNYFPIVSDRNYINVAFEKEMDYATLRNGGSTKARVEGANNPIIIEDIFDVFARQVDFMSSYNAFVPALTSIQKVYNYNQRLGKGSMKEAIKKKLGMRANVYFKNFMKDINGNVRKEVGGKYSRWAVSKYKSAAMGLNLRVIIQQPTSLLRAAALVDPKYLASGVTRKGDWGKVKKYAPIAQWKDWGYFTLDVGRQIKGLLLDETSMTDFTMGAIGKADEVTWTKIWNAIEDETKAKQPELKSGSEEFYETVAARFNEVIDRTQVVDSIFHRTALQRSNSDFTKMYVSFMSEPFKSYNLMRTALRDAKLNPSKATQAVAGRAVSAWAAATILNAAIASLADAFRDKDDEAFWKKWLASMGENSVDAVTGMFPVIRDAASMAKGYNVERMDYVGLQDAFDAIDQWRKYIAAKAKGEEPTSTTWNVIKTTVKAASNLSGVPAYNVYRDTEALANNVIKASGLDATEFEIAKAFYNIQSTSNRGRFYDILYKSYKAGDKDTYLKLMRDMMNNGVPADDINAAMKKRKIDDLKAEKEKSAAK